jgi:hypothetical protein
MWLFTDVLHCWISVAVFKLSVRVHLMLLRNSLCSKGEINGKVCSLNRHLNEWLRTWVHFDLTEHLRTSQILLPLPRMCVRMGALFTSIHWTFKCPVLATKVSALHTIAVCLAAQSLVCILSDYDVTQWDRNCNSVILHHCSLSVLKTVWAIKRCAKTWKVGA